jgi:hypothetical protein
VAYIQKHLPLEANGYRPIPIAKGYKYPAGIDQWETMVPTADDWELWKGGDFAEGGVGIVLGVGANPVGAVDVDVYDQDVVEEVADYLNINYDLVMYRVGQAPKLLYPFRMTEVTRKVYTGKYTIGDTITAPPSRVEVLGLGQQFVAFGVHPDTQRPYQWYEGTLSDTPVTDLPSLTPEEISEIVAYCDGVLSKHGRRVASSSTGAPAQGVGSYMSSRPWKPLNLDDEDVMQILEHLPRYYTSDYDDWLRVGAALHHQYKGSTDGLALWDLFSQQDEYGYGKPDAEGRTGMEALAVKWESFHHTRPGGQLVTLRGLRTAALANGMPTRSADGAEDETEEDGDPVTRMRKRYIYVAEGKEVYDRTDNPNDTRLTLDEFRAQQANNIIWTIDANGREKSTATVNLWMASEYRVSVQGTRYFPEAGLITMDEVTGKRYLNTCVIPDHQPVEEYNRIHIFKEHIEYLCPHEEDREFLLDWMAFTLQQPSRRCAVTPLHMTPTEGTGRSWVGLLLGKLLGAKNVDTTDLEDLAGVGNGGVFQEFLLNKLAIVINEAQLDEAQKKKVGGKLKTVLTDEVLNVNVKYGDKGTIRVFANVIMFTNKHAPLDLPESDRRIYVIEGPLEVRDKAYYTRLYKSLNDPLFIREVYTFLTSRQFDPENRLARAAMTEAKKAMIKSSGSLLHSVLTAWADGVADKYPGLTLEQITHGMAKRQRTDMKSILDITEATVRSALRSLNFGTAYLDGDEIYKLKEVDDATLVTSVEAYNWENDLLEL